MFFSLSHGHPFGDVGLDPFDMLNEFPDLSGGGGSSSGAAGASSGSPYASSPPGGGGGLLTTTPNMPAPMLASSSAKGATGASAAGRAAGGGGRGASDMAQITDYSPEWAWSDVSLERTGQKPPPALSSFSFLTIALGTGNQSGCKTASRSPVCRINLSLSLLSWN